jgi:AcrR family transcriptional regulator
LSPVRRNAKPRLTRVETQARTRKKLVETAKRCFLKDGYEATSLDGIAAAAGFSKGAVYSNFESKDDLCLAVLTEVRGERATSLAAAIVGCETLDARLAAFEKWAETHIGDRAWTALEIEFGIHAARTPTLRSELVSQHREVRRILGAAIAAEAQARGIALPMEAEEVALALLSLGIGLGVQRALDPTLPVRTLGRVVRLLSS